MNSLIQNSKGKSWDEITEDNLKIWDKLEEEKESV